MKRRLTRSLGSAAVLFERVVTTRFDLSTPRTQASRMRRSVPSRPISDPLPTHQGIRLAAPVDAAALCMQPRYFRHQKLVPQLPSRRCPPDRGALAARDDKIVHCRAPHSAFSFAS